MDGAALRRNASSLSFGSGNARMQEKSTLQTGNAKGTMTTGKSSAPRLCDDSDASEAFAST